MTSLKKAVLFIHRWLGFITGLVVFVVSITGCIYCFQDEIQDAVYSFRHIPPQAKSFVKPSLLGHAAMEHYPKGKVSSVLYFGADRSAQVRVITKKTTRSLYFNPYNGQFLYDQDFKNSFFNRVKDIHLHCFMPKETGEKVIGICVILFVGLMLTGIILWWPKRKTDRKRSFTIKWNSRWRRINYDLHNVLGFYATSFTLIIAFSGLNMAYEGMSGSIKYILNGGKVYPMESRKIKSDTLHISSGIQSFGRIDQAFDMIRQKSPHAHMVILIPAATKSGIISGTAYPKSLHFSFNDGYSFDRYNGRLLRFLPSDHKSPGLRFTNMNYDIHTGQILGLPGKILAFLASLITASLPVTGLILYLGKKKKRKVR